MALVKTMIEGGNTVNIFDDYCVKTQEEIDQILENVGRIFHQALVQKARKEQLEQEKQSENVRNDERA